MPSAMTSPRYTGGLGVQSYKREYYDLTIRAYRFNNVPAIAHHSSQDGMVCDVQNRHLSIIIAERKLPLAENEDCARLAQFFGNVNEKNHRT